MGHTADCTPGSSLVLAQHNSFNNSSNTLPLPTVCLPRSYRLWGCP